jgi:CheY-like chemotaxis protein
VDRAKLPTKQHTQTAVPATPPVSPTLASENDLNQHLGQTSPAFTPISSTRECIHVIVVDDNIVNQRVAGAMLDKLDIKLDVTIVSSGLECIECIKDGPVDLVFMDCQMPGLDGYETTTRIHDLGSHNDTPIIALTANASPSNAKRCSAAGMNGHLTLC